MPDTPLQPQQSSEPVSPEPVASRIPKHLLLAAARRIVAQNSESEIAARALLVLSMPAWIASLIDSSAAFVDRTVFQPMRPPISPTPTRSGRIEYRLFATLLLVHPGCDEDNGR